MLKLKTNERPSEIGHLLSLQKIIPMDMAKVPISVYAEMTPNPTVLKFVANKPLVSVDSVEFRNIEEAQPSPLATKLFHFPFVKEERVDLPSDLQYWLDPVHKVGVD